MNLNLAISPYLEIKNEVRVILVDAIPVIVYGKSRPSINPTLIAKAWFVRANACSVFDTATGALTARIPVGHGPHGLTVWPQPGRYSLGHTGNMR